MKKILFLLIAPLLFAGCSDDDEENTSYLTSLEKAKSGIIGTWHWQSASGSESYLKYGSDEIVYSGNSLAEMTAISKYKIATNNNSIVLHLFLNGDTEGVGNYIICPIIRLDIDFFIYSVDGIEHKLKRVK